MKRYGSGPVGAAFFCGLIACRQSPSPPPIDTASEATTSTRAATLAEWSKLLDELQVHRFDSRDQVVALRSIIPTDRTTLLSFWATYCPPCLEEMADLEALHRQGHAIVGISMDAGDPERAATTASKLTYPNVLLLESSMKAAGLALDRGLPFSIILGADGRPVRTVIGRMSSPQMRALLSPP